MGRTSFCRGHYRMASYLAYACRSIFGEVMVEGVEDVPSVFQTVNWVAFVRGFSSSAPPSYRIRYNFAFKYACPRRPPLRYDGVQSCGDASSNGRAESVRNPGLESTGTCQWLRGRYLSSHCSFCASVYLLTPLSNRQHPSHPPQAPLGRDGLRGSWQSRVPEPRRQR